MNGQSNKSRLLKFAVAHRGYTRMIEDHNGIRAMTKADRRRARAAFAHKCWQGIVDNEYWHALVGPDRVPEKFSVMSFHESRRRNKITGQLGMYWVPCQPPPGYREKISRPASPTPIPANRPTNHPQ